MGELRMQSLREIPAASVDFIWSQAVLEHVRCRDLQADLLVKGFQVLLRPQ